MILNDTFGKIYIFYVNIYINSLLILFCRFLLTGGFQNFNASAGWLHRFEKRHGMHSLSVQGEKKSADIEGSRTFSQDFRQWLIDNNIDLDNLYNADESGWNWRELPQRTMVNGNERKADGNKERLTIMFCSNATGTHKIKLLVIGKSKTPRGFKAISKMPIHYRDQSSSWMNATIFLDWFENIFLPEVKQEKEKTGRTGKTVLLLDNAPVHPSIQILNELDPEVEVLELLYF